jgi:tetratricopeptide (TPR) repeat protein
VLARADGLRRRGDLAGAALVLDQIAEAPADPLNAIARFTRARILIELGRRSEAAADLRRAIAAGLPPALEARARARLAELTGAPAGAGR